MSGCTDVATGEGVRVVVVRGDTMRLVVELTDKAGAPVDVTGWGWTSQLRDNVDAVAAAIVTDVPEPTTGVVQLSIDEAVTATLAVGDYVWDLQADDGTDTRTLVSGGVRIKADVTR